jgi:hypothetical protein
MSDNNVANGEANKPGFRNYIGTRFLMELPSDIRVASARLSTAISKRFTQSNDKNHSLIKQPLTLGFSSKNPGFTAMDKEQRAGGENQHTGNDLGTFRFSPKQFLRTIVSGRVATTDKTSTVEGNRRFPAFTRKQVAAFMLVLFFIILGVIIGLSVESQARNAVGIETFRPSFAPTLKSTLLTTSAPTPPGKGKGL